MAESDYHVLRRAGDGTAEVSAAVARIGSEELAGLHRCFYVSRANQTIVMTRSADSDLARSLRQSGDWDEPAE